MIDAVRNGRVRLALTHSGTPGDDEPHLLLLHALCGSRGDGEDLSAAWPGPTTTLDFSGHGASDSMTGRAYSPEIFAADADAVLAHLALDSVFVAGAGIGAYVALLLAGARSDVVRASLLLPGDGFAGGGAEPSEQPEGTRERWLARLVEAPARQPGSWDPFVLSCRDDVRPPDYAGEIAEAAGSLLVSPEAPDAPWLGAAREAGQAVEAPRNPREALGRLTAL